MELIISDGGSVCQSVSHARALWAELPFQVQVVEGQKEGGLIQSLKESYRSQDATKRLRLEPFPVPLKKGIAAAAKRRKEAAW